MALSPSAVCFRGTAILPDRLAPDTSVVCEAGRIAYVGARIPRGVPVIEGAYISPGFIDMHVHGGDGADYMDGTPDAVRIANRAHARRGTTTIFPTTTTGSTDRTRGHAQRLHRSPEDWTRSRRRAHRRRPLLRPVLRRRQGRLPFASKAAATRLAAEYDAFFKLGIIRIATCAAELPGAEAFYKAARKYRCLFTCGHSNCTWTEMARRHTARACATSITSGAR